MLGVGACLWPANEHGTFPLQEMFLAGGLRFGPAQGPYFAPKLKYVITTYAANLFGLNVEAGYRWRLASGWVIHAGLGAEARLVPSNSVMFFGIQPGVAVGWAF
jgi:hypothetical protein